MQWIKAALGHYWRAQTRFDVHAPFLARWIEAVLEDRRWYYAFDDLERVRAGWLAHPGSVRLEADLGAGSRAGFGRQRPLRALARQGGVSAAEGRLLFRLAQFHRPRTILELGTSLGLSAGYLHCGAPAARLITLEGQPGLAPLAGATFAQLSSSSNISLRQGPFAALLPEVLPELGQVDLLYIDGDHRGVALEAYLDTCLPYLHDRSVVVLADIHWSADMERAWAQVRHLPAVSQSVDLLHFGVLFFRPEWTTPQHWSLLPARYKPWRLGLWG